MMNRRVLLIAAVVGASSTNPGAAIASAATERVSVRSDLVGGPALAGEAVLWAQRSKRGGATLILRDANRTRKSLYRVPPPPRLGWQNERRGSWIGEIEASPQRIAFRYGATSVSTSARASSPTTAIWTVSTLLTGPLSGPYERLSGARDWQGTCENEASAVGGFSLDWEILAYGETREPCDRSSYGDIRVAVTDADGRERFTFGRLSSGPPHDVAVAGRYVAWVEPATNRKWLSVWDWTTGKRAYRVRVGRRYLYEREVELQRDGKVALLSAGPDGSPYKLSWASQQDPRWHTVARTRSLRNVRFRRNRMFATGTLGSDRFSRGVEVLLIDLRGRVRVLARSHRDRRLSPSADFDGERAAWAVTRTRRRDGRRTQSTAIRIARLN